VIDLGPLAHNLVGKNLHPKDEELRKELADFNVLGKRMTPARIYQQNVYRILMKV